MTEFLLDIRNVSDVELSLWYAQMDQARQEKCKLYRDDRAKKLCIAADHLIRTALAKELKISPKEVEICLSPDGKPYCEGNPLYFSYSHCDPYVAAVISQNPVGIDIEKVRAIRGKGERICTEEELKYLNGAEDDSESHRRFIEIWTKKEAIFKIEGRLPRKDKEIETLTPKNHVILTTKTVGEYILTVAEQSNMI